MEVKTAESDVKSIEELARAKKAITDEIGKVIIGQKDLIDQLLIALFARGHCIFIGVPGLAKTLLVSTLAATLDCDFSRIQFTPDLMPSDITGTDVLEEDRTTGKRVFRFIKGPLFANIILADEINRTPPKTQAAMLQAMQEYQITAAGETFPLDRPFLVFATQNPIEQEGTYPLPEAQLDRFMLSLDVDYPSEEEEREIVASTTSRAATEIEKVLGPDQIRHLQELILKVPAAENVIAYAVRLVRATRPDDPGSPDFIRRWVGWGAGPRASQNLIIGAKARAALDGRFAVEIDDIRALAAPVLKHRVITNFHAEAEGITVGKVVNDLLKEISG